VPPADYRKIGVHPVVLVAGVAPGAYYWYSYRNVLGERVARARGGLDSQLKRPQSLKLGVSAQTLPIVIGYGTNLIATPFIVASLGVTNFGLWALTGAIAQYGVLLDLGVSRAIMRYVALYHTQEEVHKERAVIGGCVMVILGLGCFLICFPLFIPAQLGDLIGTQDARLARTLFIASVAVLITGVLGSLFSSASIGRGRMVAGNIGVALQRAGVVVGGVIAILIDPMLGSFAVGSAAGGAIGLIVVLLAILADEHEIRIGRPRAIIMADVISFGLKGQLMGVAEIAIFQSGKLLAGIIIGPAAAGTYELGSRLALGARAVGTGANIVLSAHLTRGYASNGPAGILRDYARLVQRNATLCSFPLLFLTATSFSVVPVWLGVNHVDVVWVLIALTLTFTVNVSTSVTAAAAYGLNQFGIVTVIATASAILAVALEVLLAVILGLTGILIGLASAIAISTLLAVIVIHRRNSIPLADFFDPSIGPVLVGVVSVVLAMPVGIFCFPADRAAAIVPFLCSASIFCVVYTTVSWRLGYLPAIRGITGFRTRRAGVPGTDE
jgi:O-antigen/teichoic acid export membrane protein